MPRTLSPPATRHLHIALADAASGHALQWWHLELAARQPAGRPGWPASILALLIRRWGQQRLIPLLDVVGMPGLLPYRLANLPAIKTLVSDAALLALIGLGLLIGMGSLNATRQLLLILFGVLGAGWVLAWRWYQAAQVRQKIQRDQAEQAAQRVGSENALGLAALMMGAGMRVDEARMQCELLLAAPDHTPPAQLDLLGLSLPASGWVAVHGLRAGAAWLLGVLAIAWPCWLIDSPWQWLPAALGLLAVHYVWLAETSYWWRRALRDLLIAAACLGLSSLLIWW